MALSVEELVNHAKKSYQIQILAGQTGLNNVVNWIHSVEDIQVANFLRGDELVFTTAIAQTGTDWLDSFIQQLYQHKAAGLFINLGPYISEIPDEIINLCNELGFPLFSIPWKTRIVDISRDFCNQIIQSDGSEGDISDKIKRYIFHPSERKELSNSLRQNGVKPVRSCQMIIIALEEDKKLQAISRVAKQNIKNQVHRFQHVYSFFEDGKYLVYVLFEFDKRELVYLNQRIIEEFNKEDAKVHLAIGPKANNLEELAEKYKEIYRLVKIGINQGQTVLHYDDMGIFELLLSVPNQLLEQYYDKTLELIVTHDRNHATNYVEVLRLYLLYNGSIQKVSEQLFIHRNTVTYQLNQIGKILGRDLGLLEVRLELLLALKIGDLL
ncbi:MAG: PucR family transcriptional regulator [Streptococcaceae bacterium]|jgi:hypothetical protein|nr:PucR family transcriptional regulator [Streptococcaceae bacterium]